jgi:hypothetical protein
MKWMISCKEATNYISRNEEGRLSPKQRIQLWLHLGVCTFCKLFYKQNKIIIQQALQLHEKETAQLSNADKELIIARIEEEQ